MSKFRSDRSIGRLCASAPTPTKTRYIIWGNESRLTPQGPFWIGRAAWGGLASKIGEAEDLDLGSLAFSVQPPQHLWSPTSSPSRLKEQSSHVMDVIRGQQSMDGTDNNHDGPRTFSNFFSHLPYFFTSSRSAPVAKQSKQIEDLLASDTGHPLDSNHGRIASNVPPLTTSCFCYQIPTLTTTNTSLIDSSSLSR